MPEFILNRQELSALAKRPDFELSVRPKPNQQPGQSLQGMDGWWGGRLMRHLKVQNGDGPRNTQQYQYGEAKRSIESSLKDVYGDHIGELAFRAGVGHLDDHGQWSTSNDYPLTGRHIAKMVKEAERLEKAKSVNDWVGDLGGVPRDVDVGPKVSVGLGRMRLDEAWRSTWQDLQNDFNAIDPNQQHRFWCLRLVPREGQGPVQISIHIDRDNQQMVNIRGLEGERREIPLAEVNDWLDNYLSSHRGTGFREMSLHRLVDRVPGENVVGNVGNNDQDLQVKDPPVDWERLTEDFRTGVFDDHAGLNNSGVCSPRLTERMASGQLELRTGTRNPQKLESMWNLVMTVEKPEGGLALQGAMAAGFTRFLDDGLIRNVHRQMFPNGPEPDQVEIEVQTRWGENHRPVFDVVFRTPTPDGQILAIPLSVPYDEFRKPEPDFTIGEYRLEERPQNEIQEKGVGNDGTGDRDPSSDGENVAFDFSTFRDDVQDNNEVPLFDNLELDVQPGVDPPPNVQQIVDSYRDRLTSGDTMDNLDVIAEMLKKVYRQPGDREMARSAMHELLGLARMVPLQLPPLAQVLELEREDLAGEMSRMQIDLPSDRARALKTEMQERMLQENPALLSVLAPTLDVSPSLEETMRKRALSLQVGNGEPIPLRSRTDISLGPLRTIEPLGKNDQPLDERVGIAPSDRTGLSRFMDVGIYDGVYRTIAQQLGVDEGPDPDAPIEIEINARWVDPNGKTDLLDFDITLRGPLSDTLRSRLQHSDDEGLGFEVTLRVPGHQLTEPDPQFVLLPPRLVSMEL